MLSAPGIPSPSLLALPSSSFAPGEFRSGRSPRRPAARAARGFASLVRRCGHGAGRRKCITLFHGSSAYRPETCANTHQHTLAPVPSGSPSASGIFLAIRAQLARSIRYWCCGEPGGSLHARNLQTLLACFLCLPGPLSASYIHF